MRDPDEQVRLDALQRAAGRPIVAYTISEVRLAFEQERLFGWPPPASIEGLRRRWNAERDAGPDAAQDAERERVAHEEQAEARGAFAMHLGPGEELSDPDSFDRALPSAPPALGERFDDEAPGRPAHAAGTDASDPPPVLPQDAVPRIDERGEGAHRLRSDEAPDERPKDAPRPPSHEAPRERLDDTPRESRDAWDAATPPSGLEGALAGAPLFEAEARLASGTDRDEVARGALEICAAFADAAFLFAVYEGKLLGSQAIRDGRLQDLRGIVMAGRAESCLTRAVRAGRVLQGPPDPGRVDRRLFGALGFRASNQLMVLPVRAGERILAVLAVETRGGPPGTIASGAFHGVAERLGASFGRLIQERRARYRAPD